MEHTLKRNLRLIAEKYNHAIMYDKDVLIFSSDLNQFSLSSKDKDAAIVKYNTEFTTENLEVLNNELYDVVLELLSRRDKSKIRLKKGKVLDLEAYITEEGYFIKEDLDKLKNEIRNSGITSKKLPGNRILAEYFNGIIILEDDLVYYRSNVIIFD